MILSYHYLFSFLFLLLLLSSSSSNNLPIGSSSSKTIEMKYDEAVKDIPRIRKSSSWATNLSPSSSSSSPLFQMFDYYNINTMFFFLKSNKPMDMYGMEDDSMDLDDYERDYENISSLHDTKVPTIDPIIPIMKQNRSNEVIVAQTYIKWYSFNKTKNPNDYIFLEQQVPKIYWSLVKSLPKSSSKEYFDAFDTYIETKDRQNTYRDTGNNAIYSKRLGSNYKLNTFLKPSSPLSNDTTNTTTQKWWIPEDYPNPLQDPTACNIDSLLLFDEDHELVYRNKQLFLCDPDSILSFTYLNRISSALLQTFSIQSEKHTIPVQIAVALVNKINLFSVLHSSKSYYTYEEEEDMINDAAQYFSRFLYDSWFVSSNNSTSSLQNNGIMVFLSIQDHVCFISTGASITTILPWWRLEHIVSDMKPQLRRHNFGEAILTSIDDIKYTITILGPPTVFDRIYDFFMRFGIIISFCIVTFLFAVYGEYRDKVRRMQFMEDRSKFVDEKEERRAIGLMREFNVQTCPICLEPFPDDDVTTGISGGNSNHSDHAGATVGFLRRVGNDRLPLKLLRCGHAFDQTCWRCWVHSGYGNPCKCPVCRQDIGGPSPRQNYNRSRPNLTTRFINRLAVASATNFLTSTSIDDTFMSTSGGRLVSRRGSNSLIHSSHGQDQPLVRYGTFDSQNATMDV